MRRRQHPFVNDNSRGQGTDVEHVGPVQTAFANRFSRQLANQVQFPLKISLGKSFRRTNVDLQNRGLAANRSRADPRAIGIYGDLAPRDQFLATTIDVLHEQVFTLFTLIFIVGQKYVAHADIRKVDSKADFLGQSLHQFGRDAGQDTSSIASLGLAAARTSMLHTS